MSLRFYINAISQASKAFASWLFITGLILVGFGFMIYLLPRLFAILAATVFFIAGGSCGIIAIRIFLAQKKLDKIDPDNPQQSYRENVQVHT